MITQKVQWITITQRHDKQRLDNFLLTTLKGVPKSYIYRIIRKGEVRINKGRAKAHTKLNKNDVVRIPPVKLAEKMPIPNANEYLKKDLEAAILFENNYFIAINKPAGMAVHGGSGVSLGLIEAVRQMRPEAKEWELVHRLDKATSGCLMIAKRRSGLRILQGLQREHQIKKTYLALVDGRWMKQKQTVNAPLQKNQAQGGERMVRIDAAGKSAKTLFFNVKNYTDATLIKAQLITGRTHQIRVHCGSVLKHPILGDTKYGNQVANQTFRQYGLKRMFLHAQQLSFKWPETNQKMIIDAPLDPSLQNVLNQLTD